MAKGSIEAVGLSQVKQEERKSWTSIAFIWAGGVCCVPALITGGVITMGMTFSQAAFALFTGYAICVLLMTLMSILSAELGVPAVVAISGAFGKKGSSYMVSLIIAICYIFWFAFQSAICGSAFCAFMQIFNINIPVSVSIIIWGLIMCVTAVYGINWIKYLNLISVPALILILGYAMFVVFGNPETVFKITSYTPAGDMNMIAAIGITVGAFSVGSVLSGDVTRYAKSRRDVILSSIIGVIPMGVGTMLAGGILAIHSGALGMDPSSIVIMLTSIGAPILGIVTLILATWTTNVANAYSSGFALLNLLGAKDNKRAILTLSAGIAGTMLAVFGVYMYFINFLNILAAFIPPVAGVVVIDYYIFHKADPSLWKPVKGFNLAGIISWLAGALFAVIFSDFFIAPINAIVISCILYLTLYPILKKKENSNLVKEEDILAKEEA